jgi:hypothetical protein|tara:strand:+ start:159 stop:464 length:306 start_codon:yes stop_codon:yes gene_type:complete
MSQRAGDLGSRLMGCGNQSQIDKYGSQKACINNIMFGQPETKEEKALPRIGGSDTEKKVFEMQIAKRRQEQYKEAKRVRKQYIIYGLIAVAGYFAYKKFKK